MKYIDTFSFSLLLDKLLSCIETTLGSSGIHSRYVCVGGGNHMRPPTEKTVIKEVCFIKNIFLQGGLVHHHSCAQVHYYNQSYHSCP